MEHAPLFEYQADDPLPTDPALDAEEPESEMMAWEVDHQECPSCQEQIIFLQRGKAFYTEKAGKDVFAGVDEDEDFEEFLVWPQRSVRHCPTEVPKTLREDFLEAAAVLPLSPKASAALSRRCLQHLLRDFANTKSTDLSRQITEVVDSHTLTSGLAAQLDAVRNIGNFAAHMQKSTNTGEILDVEPEEAEWNLDVLDELFDHFFVKPTKAQARRNALNKKLAEAGKPLLP